MHAWAAWVARALYQVLHALNRSHPLTHWRCLRNQCCSALAAAQDCLTTTHHRTLAARVTAHTPQTISPARACRLHKARRERVRRLWRRALLHIHLSGLGHGSGPRRQGQKEPRRVRHRRWCNHGRHGVRGDEPRGVPGQEHDCHSERQPAGAALQARRACALCLACFVCSGKFGAPGDGIQGVDAPCTCVRALNSLQHSHAWRAQSTHACGERSFQLAACRMYTYTYTDHIKTCRCRCRRSTTTKIKTPWAH